MTSMSGLHGISLGRGEAMENVDKLTINEDALGLIVVEIKLHVNQKLYNKGVITEEMYARAKELILKSDSAYVVS